MNHKELLDLIGLFETSNLETLKISQGDFNLHLKKMPSIDSSISNSNSAVVTNQTTVSKQTDQISEITADHQVLSPMVGTFFRSSSPDTKPFVNIGDSVKKGDVLCIIEAMKMLNEIHSDVDGVITDIPIENGSMVDYGKTLFIIEENHV